MAKGPFDLHSMYDRSLTCLAPADAAALPIYAWRPSDLAAGLASLSSAQAAFLQASGFTGAAGELRLIPSANGIAGAALGLGEDNSPFTHASLPFVLPEQSVWRIQPGDFNLADAVLGWCLGAYEFTNIKAPKREPCRLAGAEGYTDALAMGRAVWLARDLVNTPANLLGPAELAAAAQDLAYHYGVEAELVTSDALVREYPALAAVGAGSSRPPVVARFAWSGSQAEADAPLISLCGKGVVFDTGGYDLKPSAAMLRMKKDMGGAALMLALASMIMATDQPVRLECRIGCVENMVSGHAMRPGDVLRTRLGLTVEVGNTDAEGRLVLCDLLAEASERSPTVLIDAATLTGAARVALGPDLPAFFTQNDSLASLVSALGSKYSDPLWRLPLHAGYESWLNSRVADLNNVASKPMAGAVVAALFLQRFVPAGISWLHVDTYAWNDSSRPGRPEGGEALGLRTLFATIAGLKGVNLSAECSNL